MRTYVVGGWVRDRMLEREGRPAAHRGDRDWVVVGATPEEMAALGYRPVGRDFPVFLHPQTGEEYALARTERKTAPGYRGFTVHASPEVTLEQDLARRDLTVNAMALDEHDRLVDPYGGLADLRARVLRHVGPAFVEDPVRILRLARFAARFHDFTVAPETLALARRMVEAGEADALVPERVWQELARGLAEARPARMLEVLAQTGLLARLAPRLALTPDLLEALDSSARAQLPLEARFAVLCSGMDSLADLQDWLERLRADGESARLARLLCELRPRLRAAAGAAERLRILDRADAWRRPERFALLLRAYALLEGEGGVAAWRAAAEAAAQVNAGAVAAAAGPDAMAIGLAVAQARRAAIAAACAGDEEGAT